MTNTLRDAIHPYFKVSKRAPREHVKAHLVGSGPWTVPGLCAAYGLKAGSFPGGGTIGILELDGGWVQSDLAAFFGGIGQPVPTVTDVSVDGTTNKGASGGDASVEVALDIEVAGAVYQYLTGKPATIEMLWAQDIGLAAIKSGELGHAACSCSWGADEPSWGASGLASMQAALVSCTEAGTPFFAASGDNDADDADGTGKPAVDAPASCTNAVACGGTSTPQGGPSVIWNNNPGNAAGEGTGGGYSATFTFATWCAGPKGPGRMVSDVASNADPDTGFAIIVGGQSEVVGGTSAAAPFWAGVFAALGQKGAGFVNQKLWGNPGACVPVTSGTNGTYAAAVCCGLGVPNGANLLALLAGSAPPAPSPTPPNPTPTPAPTGTTLAQAQAALRTALSGYWLLFRNEAVQIASRALAPLLSASSTPTLAQAEAALAGAFAQRPIMIGGEAIQLGDAALAGLAWP